MYYNSILEAIGNTPMVKLNKLTEGIKATILVKVEYMNPGNSTKDRMALKMIEDAEKDGRLKPGGTIIEGTSGNTGMGLAIAAVIKGYKCIFVTTDKQSNEKVLALRALGAQVVVCPTNVAPSDPRSYYSTAARLSKETPNSFYPNQYDNLSNRQAHYESTGPEIWAQTEGKITHFVAGVGTGGTISGVAKFLKEQNPAIKVIGIDTYGSVFKKYKETGIFDENEVYPYLTEGIGEDILPKNVDFDLINEFVKVTDKDGALMTRRLSYEEALFVGWSCGSAVHGALEYAREHLTEKDTMVIILPDHGTRYLNKIYNHEWMKGQGYLDTQKFATAHDIILARKNYDLISVNVNDNVAKAIDLMNVNSLSQMVVTDGENIVGSLIDSKLLHQLIANPDIKNSPVSSVMEKPFLFVGIENTVDSLTSLITPDNKALLIRDTENKVHIITQHDLLQAINK